MKKKTNGPTGGPHGVARPIPPLPAHKLASDGTGRAGSEKKSCLTDYAVVPATTCTAQLLWLACLICATRTSTYMPKY